MGFKNWCSTLNWSRKTHGQKLWERKVELANLRQGNKEGIAQFLKRAEDLADQMPNKGGKFGYGYPTRNGRWEWEEADLIWMLQRLGF